MKTLTTLILSLLFVTQAQAIEFSSKVDSDPHTVTIVHGSYSGYKDIHGYDSQGKRRVRIDIYTYDSELYLYNSKGVNVGHTIISIKDEKTLTRFIESASRSCPLILKINRSTLQVENAELKCDILSQVETQLNEG